MTIKKLLEQLQLKPILLDIGASGEPPKIWQPIAAQSVYIRFDPDSREMHEVSNGLFHRTITVNEAVVANPTDQEVTFYLTQSPYCSSTLPPDIESLSHYSFTDLFTVTNQVTVKASSLEAVLQKINLRQVDWFKTDSQGTDLRLFNSLPDAVKNLVLAVDIEPGLIDAYHGEDMFTEVHRDLTQHGFWLSDLNVQGSVRVKQSTLQTIQKKHGISHRIFERDINPSPGWVEGRYLRTVEWMIEQNATPREFVLLWAFAMLAQQFGFALDIAISYKDRFGADETCQTLYHYPLKQLKRAGQWAFLKSVVKRGINFVAGFLK